jgi:hypothetical protein
MWLPSKALHHFTLTRQRHPTSMCRYHGVCISRGVAAAGA